MPTVSSLNAVRTVKGGVRPALRARALSSGGTGEPYGCLDLAPCTPVIGAGVRGVDLAESLDAAVLAELKRALLEWKVLFFRDQQLTAARHAEVARHWGEPEIHPFLPKAEIPEVVRLAHDESTPGVENIWHSDVSFSTTPPLGSMLRAVEVPPVGGDTLWADMAAAYDGLPDAMKELIEGRTATHDFVRSFGQLLSAGQLEDARAKHPPVRHPVVRTHPETGRRLLYVNRVFTDRIDGLPEAESAELLELLYEQARHPEYQCRFHWEPGSVAFWDNRITQHYAVSDYFPAPRVMERVTLMGDRPR